MWIDGYPALKMFVIATNIGTLSLIRVIYSFGVKKFIDCGRVGVGSDLFTTCGILATCSVKYLPAFSIYFSQDIISFDPK